MNTLMEILISSVNMIFDHVNMFLSSFSDGGFLSVAGSGVTLAFALGAVAHGNITEGVLAGVRRWHGSIDDQFSSIDNLVNLVTEHQPTWTMPAHLFSQLSNNRDQLQVLVNKCRTTAGSQADRALRNALLKSTVGLCLLEARIWAYGEYTAGVMTIDDVHLLGFLLPGETGGHHARTEATDVVAEVKVKVVNEDFIRVVIDQSAGENAAQVVHGWPNGVKNALIVIIAADGTMEVYRQLTTRLHNDIRMPDGSHGKQFIIKASFLKHVNDEPRFGNEPTFFMPLTTEDLAAALDQQHHAEFEAQMQEVERQRQEIERLKAELNAKK
ncbi:MAG: hypothetical protein LBL13_05650 [Bacteroidales bacterium]|jgi:hypothetical protein|nr:hypothetical protein [Bacteroidales bacterium]